MKSFFTPKRIYLDYAAATPVRREVLSAMEPFFSHDFGNPSAIHTEGVIAKRALETARTELARTLRVRPSEVFFTGSGTESNNLAIVGYMRQLEASGTPLDQLEVLTTAIEHPSILEPLRALEKEGLTVHYCSLDDEGKINMPEFRSLFSVRTALVTFAYSNSEIGVVQDVKTISRQVRKFNQAHKTNIVIHLDAAQAPLWLPCQCDALGVDMMSLDAGKCGGPKGVGVLVKKSNIELKGVIRGGGQEDGLRAGTENVPLCVGASKAIVLAQQEREAAATRTTMLRDGMISQLLELDGVVLNGPQTQRIANNINVSVLGFDAEFAVISLDAVGIAAATQSACSGQKGGGSAVVRVITGDEARASSTVRFSLGPQTSKRDVARAVLKLREHIQHMSKSL
ncbi:cysteine desulfurase [Candidatus Kaiserbacteria bacterium]|nr:cysteine desulfurase [Candidatus Kaiserbacteria bacterium]